MTTRQGTFHPQVDVLNPERGWIEVDEGLRTLLEELWAKGYRTRYSCQGGHKGYDRTVPNWYHYVSQAPYIMFDTEADAQRFLAEYGGQPDRGGSPLVVRDFPVGGVQVDWRPTFVDRTIELERELY